MDEIELKLVLKEAPKFFLKMDTQGYDLEVFKGAEKVLNKIVAMQSEVSMKPIYEDMPNFITTLDYYVKNNFEVTGFFPVTRDNSNLAVIEFDCLLARPAE